MPTKLITTLTLGTWGMPVVPGSGDRRCDMGKLFTLHFPSMNECFFYSTFILLAIKNKKRKDCIMKTA